MVMMVMSCAHSLRDPTQQDISVTHISSSEEPSRVRYAI